MKKTCILLIFLFNTLISLTSFSQNTSPVWSGYYRGLGNNSDRFRKIVSDGSGNFICTGYTFKPGNRRDILTVKINSSGDTLWWKTKNGKNNGDDEGVSAGVDASGNVYVAGFVDGGNSGYDIELIKYDASGVVQWDTTWISTSLLDDIVVDMKVDASGNCYVGGYTIPDTFSGNSDYITLKYATNGALTWSKQFSRTGVLHGKDELSAITLDIYGNVWVTGRSENNNQDDDFMSIKYDGNSGNELIQIPYNGSRNDRATDIEADHSGNIIVTGRSDNGNDWDYRTIKYNNSGSFQWSRLYNSPYGQDDRPVAIGIDLSNNVIVTGYADIDPLASTNYDFQTIKYDSAGSQLWVVRTGSVYSQDDRPYDIAIDNSGNIFVTGIADVDPNPGSSDNDFMTLMYNASGSLQWNNSPNFQSGTFMSGDDLSNSLVLDGIGNVYVAGGLFNNITQKDATVIKYDIASGNQVWLKNYDGIGDFSESARSIVVDANKNSYAAGYTATDAQNLNGCISKFDPSGTLLCTYLYNGSKNDDDEFNSIAIASGGSIYAIGYTKVSGQKSDMLLVKWNSATCDTIWTRTYDFAKQSDKAESMVVDVSENIYVTGKSDSNPVDSIDNNDIVTIKYNSNGNVLWTQRYNSASNLIDEPTKVILDNNGDVLVGGKTEIGDDDIFVIKYNSSTGSPVWAQPIVYDGPFANDDRLTDIAVDGSNNIFVSGYSQTGISPSTNDPVILKYDASGNQTGFNSVSGLGKDEVVKIALDNTGNLYALYKYDVVPGILVNTYDMLLKKFDNQLTTSLWSNPPQYNGPVNGDDFPSDLILSPSGNIFITGTIDNDTTGGKKNQNWITLGYNDQGQLIFSSNVDGPNTADDSPKALVINGNDMWVCGYTEGTGINQKDLTVVNYSLIGVGIKAINPTVSANVFPNPFNNECNITLKQHSVGSAIVLTVYDMLGNKVAQELPVYESSFRIQKGNLSAGIYEYRITEGSNSIANGKLIIN